MVSSLHIGIHNKQIRQRLHTKSILLYANIKKRGEHPPRFFYVIKLLLLFASLAQSYIA